MTEEEKARVRALFTYVIKMLKSNAEITSRVSADVASLTLAVQGLDPTFEEILTDRTQRVDEISDPVVRANLDRFDDMIRQVENGEFL